MPFLDILIVTMLVAFIAAGFFFGLLQMVGAIVGFVVGVWLAGRFGDDGARLISPMVSNANFARLLSMYFIFFASARLFGYLMHLVNRVFAMVSIIPFTRTINRLLGAAFGFVEGALGIGLAIWLASRYPVNETLTVALQQSTLAPAFQAIGSILAPLLPQAMRVLESVI